MSAAPLGVYVHWPFCKSKCPYCDFNSHVRDGVEQARWRAALLRELEHGAREAPGRRVETMFFGGGTPSLMEPETVAALIVRTKQLWDSAPEIEITLEANPTSVEAGHFAALAETRSRCDWKASTASRTSRRRKSGRPGATRRGFSQTAKSLSLPSPASDARR